jgi:hypothetical protein
MQCCTAKRVHFAESNLFYQCIPVLQRFESATMRHLFAPMQEFQAHLPVVAGREKRLPST